MASNREKMASRLIINKIEEGEETVSMEILRQHDDDDHHQGIENGNKTEVLIENVYCTPWTKGYLKPNIKDVSKLLIDTTMDMDALTLNIDRCIITMESLVEDDLSQITLNDNQQGEYEALKLSTYNDVENMDPLQEKPKNIDELCNILRDNLESNDKQSQDRKKMWKNIKPTAELDEKYNFWDYYLKKIINLNKNIKINHKNLEMLLYSEDYYELFEFRNKNMIKDIENEDTKMKNDSNYVCEFCLITLTSFKKLLKHQKIHKNKDGYKCVYCNITFDLFKKAYAHWCNECPGIHKIFIASQDSFICENCHYQGLNAHIMPSHIMNADNLHLKNNESLKETKQILITLKCKNCGYISTRKQKIALKNLCEISKLCHICGKVNNNYLTDCNHDNY